MYTDDLHPPPLRAPAAARTRLALMGPPRLDGPGLALELGERTASKPVELMLRLAAAGPAGSRADALEMALWPDIAPRARRASLRAAIAALATLAGAGEPPVRESAGHVGFDPRVLEVDSIVLERALAPLLVPYADASSGEREKARRILAEALARPASFLPGFDAPWAAAARLRIADAIASAARRLAAGE